jgi:hypothetical protein
LGFIDKLQHYAIRITTGHRIIAGGVGILRRRFQNVCSHGHESGIEVVHIRAAIDVKGDMMEPRGIPIMRLLFPRPTGGFEPDREHAVLLIGERPTRAGRRVCTYRDPAVAQQGQDGIIKRHRPGRIGNRESQMAEGSPYHYAFLSHSYS